MKRTEPTTPASSFAPPSGAAPEAVVDAMRRINQALRVSSRALQEAAGISGAQLGALRHLADAPAMSLGELAQRLRTRHSSASAVIARLVRLRFVERMRNPADARRVILRLTRSGRALVRDAPADADVRLAAAAASLPRARQRELAAGLDLLAGALQRTGTAADPPRESAGPLRAARDV